MKNSQILSKNNQIIAEITTFIAMLVEWTCTLGADNSVIVKLDFCYSCASLLSSSPNGFNILVIACQFSNKPSEAFHFRDFSIRRLEA